MSLAVFYVCFYAGLGLLQPLLPLYLTEHGMPAHVATRLLALGPLAIVLVPPLVGFLADAFRARAAMLRAAIVLCTLSMLAFMQVPAEVNALFIVSIIYSVLRAPIPTLIDAAAYAKAELTGRSYGRLRTFGSIGFMLGVLSGGGVVHAFGWATLLVCTAVAFSLALAATLVVPVHHDYARKRIAIPWRRLLEQRELWLFLAVIAISQVGASAYDACYALHLKQLGYGEQFVGLAWGLGVLAEIFVMMASGRMIRAWGAERLLAIAFATAALRWLLVASVTSAGPILVLQLLHGITFPLYWVPAVMLVNTYMPRELGTAAQGLLAAAASIGAVIGMWVAGPLLESGGGERVYTYAAGTALLATIGALLLARARTAIAGSGALRTRAATFRER